MRMGHRGIKLDLDSGFQYNLDQLCFRPAPNICALSIQIRLQLRDIIYINLVDIVAIKFGKKHSEIGDSYTKVHHHFDVHETLEFKQNELSSTKRFNIAP